MFCVFMKINGLSLLLLLFRFWTRNAGPKKLVVIVLLVIISSLKIPKAFLVCSAVQLNFTNTFMLIFPTDLLSQIFKLISN